MSISELWAALDLRYSTDKLLKSVVNRLGANTLGLRDGIHTVYSLGVHIFHLRFSASQRLESRILAIRAMSKA